MFERFDLRVGSSLRGASELLGAAGLHFPFFLSRTSASLTHTREATILNSLIRNTDKAATELRITNSKKDRVFKVFFKENKNSPVCSTDSEVLGNVIMDDLLPNSKVGVRYETTLFDLRYRR